MEWEQLDLNPRIIAAVEKGWRENPPWVHLDLSWIRSLFNVILFYCSANFRSAKEILCVSGPDLQRLTRLSKTDVQRLHCAAAAAVRKSKPVTGGLRCTTVVLLFILNKCNNRVRISYFWSLTIVLIYSQLYSWYGENVLFWRPDTGSLLPAPFWTVWCAVVSRYEE